MAYKFQLGQARLSGSITQNSGSFTAASTIDATGDLTVGSITMSEFTVDSSGNTDVDGTLNVEGVPTFQAAAVFSSGISSAGAIAGATTIDASGDLTVGTITMSEFTVAANGNTDIDGTLNVEGVPTFQAGAVFSGGITTAGAIAGATTISASSGITGSNFHCDGAVRAGQLLGDSIGLSNASGLFDASSGLTQSGGELTVSLNEFAAAVVDPANDSIAIVDANDSNKTKKESIADLATQMAGNGLSASGGAFAVGVDDSSIEINSDALRVKDGGIDNDMLAGSIANAKLANSSLTIGSTSVALGATQTTFAGITQLTASNIRVDNLDVITVNSITQTENTLEIADKKIVAGLSGSSGNGFAYQFGGGADDNGLARMHYFDAGGGTVGLKFAIGNNDQLVMRSNLFIPENNNVVSLGAASNRWSNLHTTAITLGGTAITATAAELNLLDSGAGSSVTLAAGDGVIMFDADDSNNPKKVLMSDITTLVGNSVATTVQTLTAASPSLTVANGQIVLANRGSAMTITLDTPANHNGKRIVIKKIGAGDVTITANGSENIDGQSGDIILQSPMAAVTIVSDGSHYFIV